MIRGDKILEQYGYTILSGLYGVQRISDNKQGIAFKIKLRNPHVLVIFDWSETYDILLNNQSNYFTYTQSEIDMLHGFYKCNYNRNMLWENDKLVTWITKYCDIFRKWD